MRIAIIGSGVSGLTAAYLLSRKHDVVVYEASDRLGGHTATIDIQHKGQAYAIDTGFIVFNNWTYPNFQKLLAQIGVDSQSTEMGFSVTCEESGLEYSGASISSLFAQRRNIFRLSHWRMIRDILRFNKQAPKDIVANNYPSSTTLGQYLQENNYSKTFIDKYLIPMGAAIWSASTSVMHNFPLQFFVKFFMNHGLLSINDRPQWRVIKGGSKSYLAPLTASFQDRIRLGDPVVSIRRSVPSADSATGSVTVTTASGHSDIFEHVVIATHSDQALSILADPSPTEQQVLGDIGYQDNEVVLHTDYSLLPNNRSTWSSWNYRIINQQSESRNLPVLTYNMNILQSIRSGDTFCVTLNGTSKISPEAILGTYHYAHPVFSLKTIAAQQQWSEVNGPKNTWYCGAYWANGFHEDGVKSAVRVAEQFGIDL